MEITFTINITCNYILIYSMSFVGLTVFGNWHGYDFSISVSWSGVVTELIHMNDMSDLCFKIIHLIQQ